MPSSKPPFVIPFVLLVTLIPTLLYQPLVHRYNILGVGRSGKPTPSIHGHELRVLDDTLYVEDLHYHAASGLIFGASDESVEARYEFFPPMAFLRSPEKLGQGSIVVVDSKTLKTTQLRLENFSGTFTTHGIDIYTPSSDPDSVYIFAVNHLPNPAYWSPPPRTNASALEPKARSQIEIFRHELGSDSATHIRSVWDPLVRTPNDILAISETEFYFTNDHYYREGTLRLVEDVGFDLTPWTDIIHVKLSGLESVKSSSEGVTASVAFKHQNTNGIGHGASDDEVLVGRAAAGVMVRTKRKAGSSELKSLESIQLDSTIDNPSYFRDRYAKETGRDASGYVLGGLLEAVKYPKEDGKDPVVVWLVQKSAGTEGKAVDDGWNKTAIFQDDGSVISSASTAVLAPIDPKENDGRKQGWLFVSGPTSKATVAARVDL